MPLHPSELSRPSPGQLKFEICVRAIEPLSHNYRRSPNPQSHNYRRSIETSLFKCPVLIKPNGSRRQNDIDLAVVTTVAGIDAAYSVVSFAFSIIYLIICFAPLFVVSFVVIFMI